MTDIEHLQLLEEKINFLLDMIRKLKEENNRLLRHAKDLENQLIEKVAISTELNELKNQIKILEQENRELHDEREHVKSRIESLITELDSIELSESTNELFSDGK